MENDEDRQSAYDTEAMSSEPDDSEQDDPDMIMIPNITPKMSEEEKYFRLGLACAEFTTKLILILDDWFLDELMKWNRLNHPKLPKKTLRWAVSRTFEARPVLPEVLFDDA